jgi:exodeoxyribonuclease X
MNGRIRTVDFETTGTAPPEEVIEVGWCDVDHADDGCLIDLPTARMHGSKRITAETRCIHHISPAEVDGLPPFSRDAWIEEAKADGVAVLAAHHADFEAKWMGDALPWICTYKAALRLWPDLTSHSNQYLRYWIEEQGMTTLDRDLARPAHRAGPDAYATAHVLRQLLAHASVADLIAWTKEPAVIPRLPIGKQRGAKWSEVDAGFLEWMTRQATMEHDLKWNAQREIDRRRDQLRPR